MAKEHPSSRESGHPPYETRDASIRPLLIFTGILVTGTFLVLASMALLLRFFESQHAQADPPRPPLVVTGEIPPGPLLEIDQGETLRKVRRRDEEILTGYGWVDREAGIVRIPIERALELTAERGLPARGEKPEAAEEEPGEETESAD